MKNVACKKPLTRIQKIIGKRMLQSKTTKPCFYIETDADITNFMSLRQKLRKKFGIKITTNTFYNYCLAQAVLNFPLTVASIKDENLIIAPSVNIGFAVQAPQGLVVPVIKNVQNKSLDQIAKEEKMLTEKARDNKLTLEDIQGETIALSYLGPYNINSFIAILPPPASTIIAIGKITQKPIPANNSILHKKFVTLNLAADARILTYQYAAKFLDSFREKLQNPADLL